MADFDFGDEDDLDLAVLADLEATALAARVEAASAAAAPPPAPPPPPPRPAAPPTHPPPPPPASPATASLLRAAPPDPVPCPWLKLPVTLDRAAATHWLYPAGSLAPRPYQLAITRTALLHNTLVCLPTGLGKTLIGAAVLANFLRWFPGGKCVFTAPTRPLVSQQASACLAAMGPALLPPGAVREMVGSAPGAGGGGGGGSAPAARAAAWADPAVRVVFTTPQAFKNDVCLGACPFEAVVCVVVDECHRCVGRSDGAVALRFMAEKGAKFRTVGLSATPGSCPSSVQAVVDVLGAARIEHRGLGDADVAPYVHPVVSEVVVVSPSAAAARRAAVAWAGERCLRAVVGGLVAAVGASRGPDTGTGLRTLDAARLTRADWIGALGRVLEVGGGGGGGGGEEEAAWLRAGAAVAGARDALLGGGGGAGAPAAALAIADGAALPAAAPPAALAALADFRSGLGRLAAAGEPKMAALVDIVAAHLTEAEGAAAAAAGEGGDGAAAAPASVAPTRVIVFTSLRERVGSIVAALASPSVAGRWGGGARAFIGQGAAGGGSGSGSAAAPGRGSGRGSGGGSGPAAAAPGMTQREQRAVLADFRAGAFPILVATCIGEEGLDVPQVDLCVCWDAAASPVRGVQRCGRTGRGRPGRVVHLLSEGREVDAHAAGKAAAAALQGALKAQAFRLAARAPRMLPREFVPVRVDVEGGAAVEEAEAVEEGKKPAAAAPKPPPRAAKAATPARPARQPPTKATAAAGPSASNAPPGLLFPAESAPFLSLAPPAVPGGPPALIVRPPPASPAPAAPPARAPTPPRPPLVPIQAPPTAADDVSARLTQLTVSAAKGGREEEEEVEVVVEISSDEEEEEDDRDGGPAACMDDDGGGAFGWGDDDGGLLDGAAINAACWSSLAPPSTGQTAATPAPLPGRGPPGPPPARRVLLDSTPRPPGPPGCGAAPPGPPPSTGEAIAAALAARAGGGGGRAAAGWPRSALASTGGGEDSGGGTGRRPRVKRLRRAGGPAAPRSPSPRRLALDEAALPSQQQPRRRRGRRGGGGAAAAAFIDAAAGEGEDDDGGHASATASASSSSEDGSFESSFVDDASQPCPATDARGCGGGGGGYASQLALVRAVATPDTEGSGGGGSGGSARARGAHRGRSRVAAMVAAAAAVAAGRPRAALGAPTVSPAAFADTPGAGDARATQDTYDRADSFLAASEEGEEEGGGGGGGAADSHESTCGLCGRTGSEDTGGLLGCAHCPAAAHPGCVGGRPGGGGRWVCAVCSDE